MKTNSIRSGGSDVHRGCLALLHQAEGPSKKRQEGKRKHDLRELDQGQNPPCAGGLGPIRRSGKTHTLSKLSLAELLPKERCCDEREGESRSTHSDSTLLSLPHTGHPFHTDTPRFALPHCAPCFRLLFALVGRRNKNHQCHSKLRGCCIMPLTHLRQKPSTLPPAPYFVPSRTHQAFSQIFEK
jgi:hypothetical protein